MANDGERGATPLFPLNVAISPETECHLGAETNERTNETNRMPGEINTGAEFQRVSAAAAAAADLIKGTFGMAQ